MAVIFRRNRQRQWGHFDVADFTAWPFAGKERAQSGDYPAAIRPLRGFRPGPWRESAIPWPRLWPPTAKTPVSTRGPA